MNASTEDKKSKKIPFTLRLEEDLIERLENIAQNTSKAAVARNFLNLSHFIITQPDFSTEFPDGTQLMMLPKNLLKNIFSKLERVEQLEFGNELGRIFNTNCSIRRISSINNKILYLQTIGWFDVKRFPGKSMDGKKITHYGIQARIWPLDLIHAFLYRILHNHQYPNEWRIENFKDLLRLNSKEFNREIKNYRNDPDFKKIPDIINEYEKMLGGHIQNFSEDCFYYLFDSLAVVDD